MMDLCFTHRAEELEHKYLDAGAPIYECTPAALELNSTGTGTESRIMLNCVIPLSEIVTDFFDQLKSRSSGFASFEYVVRTPKWSLG